VSAVRFEVDDRVGRVTLERPPLNVIDLGVARELAAVLDEAGRRDDLVGVVLAAAGKVFCAGVDVRDHLPDRGAQMLAAFHAACERLHALPCPVVAAVHGAALGGGCELTLVCDIVVASTRATFAQPEIKLGVFPPLAAVALPGAAPRLAADLVLTGRSLTAAEAYAAGLVTRLAEPEQFPAALDQLVGELRALSPASLRLTKQALRVARPPVDFAAVAAAERLYVERLMHSPDAVEGLTAFLEKRPPAWRS
jgi:cyclohexa-1,5-dienecarbonyl-CoA hydratase